MTNKIIIGSEEYTDEYIRLDSINGINTSSLVGDMLEIDQFKFRVSWVDKSNVDEVYQTKTGAILRDSNQKVYRLQHRVMPNLLNMPYATQVLYYQDNALRLKMYFDHADRLTKTDFNVTCISAVGILDKQTHYGGIYTGETVRAVITDIINGAIPWGISSELANYRVYGWLPIESKREALHQLLFAFGANILKSNSGDIYFDFLRQTSVKQIPENRIFFGGKAQFTPPATQVEVIEHTYFQSANDETITLFDNTAPGSTPAGNTFVAFAEAPCYSLQASAGLTIDSYGVNWAIISGTGILTGKRYAHQTGLALRAAQGASGQDKIVRSSKCTLVSMLTSANVSRRLLSYYGAAQRFNIDIERTNEVVGDQVRFTSPFGDTITGFLGSLNWKCTSFERAQAEIIMNYEPTPPGGGGGFNNVAVITSNGNWTVPANVTEIHLVLIGGGQGGQGGKNGAAGTAGTSVTSQAGQTKNGANGVGGAGGAAGVGGHGGKVFSALYQVTPGASLSASIGAGGSGGAVGGSYGSEGGDTTVSGGGISASSANGAIPAEGYYDIVNHVWYAAEGGNGTPGAAGGSGGNVSDNSGNMGGNVGSKTGGNAGSVVSSSGGTRTAYTKPADNSYVQTVDESAGEYSSMFSIPYMTARKATVTETIPNDVTVNDINGNFSIPSSYTQQSFAPIDTRGQTAIFASGRNFIIKFWHWYPMASKYRLVVRTYTSVQGTASPAWTASQFAGGGGGASISANGSNASNNNAGAGASASAPSAPTVRGTGGNGGHGGGGGGGGGGATITTHANYTGSAVTKAGGTAGAAGAGSAGSNGAAGCVIIYY